MGSSDCRFHWYGSEVVGVEHGSLVAHSASLVVAAAAAAVVVDEFVEVGRHCLVAFVDLVVSGVVVGCSPKQVTEGLVVSSEAWTASWARLAVVVDHSAVQFV